jgi:hypothetical protein
VINSAVAYVAAAITALVLLAAGVALAGDNEGSSMDAAEPTSTTVRPAPATAATTTTAPAPVNIPPLGGLNPSAAVALLRDLGLEAVTSEVDAVVAYAIDVVVSSEPTEGTSVLPGNTVNIVIGRRPEPTFAERATILPWNEVDWVDAVDRTVGRCSVARQDGVGLFLDPVECAEPHDFQFLGEVPLETQPLDAQATSDAVRLACTEIFENFVGADYPRSSLYLFHLTPSVDVWNSGSRSGECLIGPPTWSQQIVGDAAGSLW